MTNRKNKTRCKKFVWVKTLIKYYFKSPFLYCLPIRGTASEVVGMISDTKFMKTVSDRRTVTSAKAPINTKVEISIIWRLFEKLFCTILSITSWTKIDLLWLYAIIKQLWPRCLIVLIKNIVLKYKSTKYFKCRNSLLFYY